MYWLHYWQTYLDDHTDALDQLANDGFILIDEALPQDLYAQLVRASQDASHYQAAKISAGGRVVSIRSDSTHWIEEHDEVGKHYLAALHGLGAVLNQSLYLVSVQLKPIMRNIRLGSFTHGIVIMRMALLCVRSQRFYI